MSEYKKLNHCLKDESIQPGLATSKLVDKHHFNLSEQFTRVDHNNSERSLKILSPFPGYFNPF